MQIKYFHFQLRVMDNGRPGEVGLAQPRAAVASSSVHARAATHRLTSVADPVGGTIQDTNLAPDLSPAAVRKLLAVC